MADTDADAVTAIPTEPEAAAEMGSGPGEDVTADVTGEADGAAEPTDGDSTPGITRTLSEGSDAVVLSVRRLSNIVQMLVDMNSAAVKDDSQLDLRTAAKLMGQLLLGDDVGSWSVGGVSVKQSTNDLLTVLSASVEHAKGLLNEMRLTAEESELLKLQERWSQSMDAMETVAGTAKASRTYHAVSDGSTRLGERLSEMMSKGSLSAMQKRALRIKERTEGLWTAKASDLAVAVSAQAQQRMGMMEETLEAWLVGQGIDKALVQQAIGVARAEMETGQLQAMYNSYVQGDTTATAGGAQMEALSTMVSQLGRAAASATELQALAVTPEAIEAAEAAVKARVEANPALVESVKDVLQQSFAGELALASLTNVTAGGWPKDPTELAAVASRALELAADNSHIKEYAQVATKNATAAVDSVVRSVADTGAMQVEALVRSMTTDEATVSTVLELVTMLLPEATAVTAMTVAQAVEVMNDDATVIQRAAEHLVRMAGGYSLKQVVTALSEDQGVVDSVLAALDAALPSTDLTLAQVVSFMSDPKAAEHVAVRLADRARVLSLGQLVELASSDPGTRASALKTIAGLWGGDDDGDDGKLATMTIHDMLGAVNDDAVATGAARLVSSADQILSYLDASASDEKLGSILDKAEDALCSQLAGVDMADLMRVGEAALTDASAREQLIHRVTDAALEFLLSVLPNLPVPPIEGVREGVVYNISQLDLTGVKLQKQDVQVVVGDHSAIAGETDSMHIAIVNIGALFKDLKWSYEQTYFPFLMGDGVATATVVNAQIHLKFSLKRRQLNKDGSTVVPTTSAPPVPPAAAAAAVTSAFTDPSLTAAAAAAAATATSSDELSVTGAKTAETWSPVICLRTQEVKMAALQLTVEGAAYSWLYNLLCSLFAELIKYYLEAALMDLIRENAGELLDTINGFVNSPATGAMLLRACNTELHALQPVTEDDVFSTDATHEREVELLFRKPGPLGMKLKPDKVKSLHSVQSVHAVGQAMDWCTTHHFPPGALTGAHIVAVNGSRVPTVGDNALQEAHRWLANPRRPLSVSFLLRPGALVLAKAQQADQDAADAKAAADQAKAAAAAAAAGGSAAAHGQLDDKGDQS